MSCSNEPTYVYKLVPHTCPVPLNPSALPDALPVSDIDRSSGFVHLSTAHQLPGTLAHFFASDPRVYVLRLPYAPLASGESRIRWESPEGDVCGPRPGEGLFPHLYNGLRVGRAEVEGVWVLERGEARWEEAIAGDDKFRAWLVY
ncbi:hypothetical protein OG21DRAFT_780979 [Imleria badia]|nr:hypothetical protein OG21DRAFT_780979 [Imleria badia]